MTQIPDRLPAAYEKYLAGTDERFLETVRPVLQQSVAEGLHGVHVRRAPDEVQAYVDDTVPFGQVVEEVG